MKKAYIIPTLNIVSMHTDEKLMWGIATSKDSIGLPGRRDDGMPSVF